MYIIKYSLMNESRTIKKKMHNAVYSMDILELAIYRFVGQSANHYTTESEGFEVEFNQTDSNFKF